MQVLNPRVVSVKPGKDFILKLTFSNGETGVFDVKPLLSIGLFKELTNPAMFNSVRLFLGTVQWQNGLDLCPDTLYIDSDKVLAKVDIEWVHPIVAEKAEPYENNMEKSVDSDSKKDGTNQNL